MNASRRLAGAWITAFILLVLPMGSEASTTAKDILKRIGVSRGICVVLGDATGEMSVELARSSDLMIYLQLPRGDEVESTRRAVDKEGLYGTRIFVEKGSPTHIHLADHLADAVVVVDETTSKLREREALRVLRPRGRALLGDRMLVKPEPEGGDDWAYPFHGPDNNPQSSDQVARAPYLTQFLAEPRWAPVPQVAVSSAGRIFKIFGDSAPHEREESLLNTLAAFNGYNGTLLWKRKIMPGIMVLRNTIIATPDTLYLADDKSCKLIDAQTGRIKGEIAPSPEVSGGTFWKWMALEDGVLYALIGGQEQKDRVPRWRNLGHGWGGNQLGGRGFTQKKYPWGFGRDILAIDVKSGEVLWHYTEEEPVDSRAMVMKNGRLFLFRLESLLTCLDTESGEVLWRKTAETAPDLFEAFGEVNEKSWDGWTAWKTAPYLRCSNDVLFFSGMPLQKLLAVSAGDGRVLWENPTHNYYLILRDDGLYGIGGGVNKQRDLMSRKLDLLTGEVLAELKVGRQACTRATGSIDGIFMRANEGTTRFDIASEKSRWISPMRPQCNDGVTIANGLIYSWPHVCDCHLSITGVSGLGPAGDFDFNPHISPLSRLERSGTATPEVATMTDSEADWPTYRADNTRSLTSRAVVPETSEQLWVYSPRHPVRPTAPIAAGGLVFVSGSDGIVHAWDASTGQPRWKAYTGGEIRYSPTYEQGRVYVGSGDGWVYAYEAQSGAQLWRFQAAPYPRKIPVFGTLLSTWPAASGVLVEDGTAYTGAGILNYDGTYVYALDAVTGSVQWKNTTSGHLDPEARTGVSVQGHLLLHDGKLYMAGGTVASPAVYDITDGICLNAPGPIREMEPNATVENSPRGSELFLFDNTVHVSGKPFYSDPQIPVYEFKTLNRILHASSGGRDIGWVHYRSVQGNVPSASAPMDKVMCFKQSEENPAGKYLAAFKESYMTNRGLWSQPSPLLNSPELKPLWERECHGTTALAVSKNAVLVANRTELMALNLNGGGILWIQSLPAPPIPWGLAIDRDGRAIISLEDGRVLGFGRDPRQLAATEAAHTQN